MKSLLGAAPVPSPHKKEKKNPKSDFWPPMPSREQKCYQKSDPGGTITMLVA